MKGRSKVSGKGSKARKPNAPKFKNRSASKQATRITASVAGEQREIARLTRELNEALEQQTATSEVLRVISSSPSNLNPILQTILANATRICEANFGILNLPEGDAFPVAAMHNAGRKHSLSCGGANRRFTLVRNIRLHAPR